MPAHDDVVTPTGDDVARFWGVLRKHGWNATSFQALEPGASYLFIDDEAAVAYVDTGSAWVAAGAPVAAADRLRDVTARFIEEAAKQKRRACFFAVEDRFAQRADVDSTPIGEQPAWDPRAWDATLKGSRSLREQVRRAKAKDVVVRVLAPDELKDGPTRARIDALVQRWLGARAMAPMGFLVRVHLDGFHEERRVLVAEREGALVGIAALVPIYARQGFLLEDLLRAPDAPNGTLELLFDAAMRDVAARGCTFATLGLAPLAGHIAPWLRVAQRLGRGLYDFDGLRAFKAKLRPERWDTISLAVPRGGSVARGLLDALTAFANGDLLRFGVDTLARGPALVIRTMATALLPWTAALLLVDVARFFPSSAVRDAWVAFDLALAGALIVLTHRWRRWLAVTLAVVVTIDALVTTAQVAWLATARTLTWVDVPILAAAVAAPAFAAALLWSGHVHRLK